MSRLLQAMSPVVAVVLIALTLASCSSGNSSNIYRTEYSIIYASNGRVEAARNGNLHALKEVLGNSLSMYDYGMTVALRPDVHNPLEWLQKGVDQEEALSQARMAYYIMYSPGTRHDPKYDPEKAWELVQAALANTTLPLGTRNASSKAAQIARQADAEKLTREVVELARRIETVLQQQPLAEKGDAEAAYAVSQAYGPFDVELLWYKHSKSFSGKRSAYVNWLRRAAEAGHVDAIHEIVAVAPDSEKSAWEVKSTLLKAKNKNLEMYEMFALANKLMADGQEAEALKWYKQAADLGNQRAKKVVLQHTDPTVVRLKAIGDANAMYELGEYFRVGNWEGREVEVAHEWYLRASARGVVDAGYWAAMTAPQSQREQLMQRAARQGHVQAEQWLAAERNKREQKAEQERQAAETKRQQQQKQQAEQELQEKAFVAEIDQHGSTDMYQISLYCSFGGRRCTELQNAALRAQAQRNRQGQTPASGTSDAERRQYEAMQKRSECLRKRAEAQDRYHRGLQTTYDSGPC